MSEFSTKCVRAGQEIDPQSKGTSVPIYLSSAYEFEDATDAAEKFNLQRPGNIYARINNTTVDTFEKRMASLEGGVAAVSTASGQSAVFLSIINICKAGDNIVASPYLYGGTYTMFACTLPELGINVKFAADDSPRAIKELIDEHTKAVFVEFLGNPTLSIPDLDRISHVCMKSHVCFIVDNTFGMGGFVCNPIKHGANVVVHSATKWICGHGTVVGGVVIDGGNFDWDEEYPQLSKPSPSYHNLVYTEVFGKAAYAGRLRVDGLRNIGPAMSPMTAFVLLQGLETLPMRAERHCENALKVAYALQINEHVDSVNFPSISKIGRDLTDKYCNNISGSVLTFRVGSYEKAKNLLTKFKLILHAVSVGDAKTLITHPASTTHSQLTLEEQEQAGIYPDMLRLSVGLEDADDLIEDLEAALDDCE